MGDASDALDDNAAAVNGMPLEGNMPDRFIRARSISDSDMSRVESVDANLCAMFHHVKPATSVSTSNLVIIVSN